MLMRVLMILSTMAVMTKCNYPVFDVNTQMRLLLLPSDARIGSVIYRLRATDSDRDYPLVFDATDYGSYVVKIENLPCTKNSSFCEANVFLERSLVPNQVFKFRITVRDTRGDTTTLPVQIQVTDGVTDFNEVFPHVPGVIMIPENTKVGTELEYVIVRKHPRATRPANLELWGASNFKFQQSFKKDTTTGIIKLVAPVDYELKTMYRLYVFATGMYVDQETDSRNVAGFQVVVVVTDVQDTPPVWDHIEPITKLNGNLSKGDIVMRVTAKDGDKGSPRDIRYGLVSEGNPFTVFFSIDQVTGDIRLIRPLKELTAISRSHQPILLTVMAEEVAVGRGGPPAMSSTATVAFLLGELGNTPPYFETPNYVCRIDENSLQGTPLVFGDPYITEVKDNDMGKQGVFSLELVNNNGTFEISPTVGERQAHFIVRVRDNTRLDYEKYKELRFKIVAKERNPSEKPLSSTADVIVYINDVNDNPPVFKMKNYTVEIPENITAGIHVLTVEASDVDTGDGGKVKYTAILGYKNTSLNLNPDTGVILTAKNNHGFDREESSEYMFYIEARDMKGTGNRAVVPFLLRILDVNDNPPKFEQTVYQFILGPDGMNFSQRAFVKATDDDAEEPNNVVRYEIINGNYGNRFLLNSETGELTINQNLRIARQTLESVADLLIRAYDLGVPTMSTQAQVKIFPAESGARVMRFIVPGRNPDRYSVEQMISALTGGRVVIHNIVPYNGQPFGNSRTTDLTSGHSNIDKSVVTATVLYNSNAVVDIENIQKRLYPANNKSSSIQSDPVIYKNDTTALFWLLVALLLLIALALLVLFLCCFCAACPLYGTVRTAKKKTSVHERERIQYVRGDEEKGQWINGNRQEAWSGDPRPWQFNRRNNNEQQRMFIMAPGASEELQRQQPNIILTREAGQGQGREELILEDIDGTEYRVLDPSRLSIHPIRQEVDSDSMKRHEFERGSDQGGHELLQEEPPENPPPSRDQMFIRDGNAEILRLITRGREIEDEEPQLNQPERPFTIQNGMLLQENDGKVVLLRRFIEDQSHSAPNQATNTQVVNMSLDVADPEEELKKIEERIPDNPRGLSTADVNRLTHIQRDLLLTRYLFDEQRRNFQAERQVEDTQSLPGVVAMGTQTDVEIGTQTDKTYFWKRRSKSDNDDSLSENEDGGNNGHRRFKRKRFISKSLEEKDGQRGRSLSRCEIKTPIIEEDHVEGAAAPSGYAATKTSLLRQAVAKSRLENEEQEDGLPHKPGVYRVRSLSDIYTLAKHRQGVLQSLEITPVRQVNINGNTNVVVEEVRHDERRRSKSVMSFRNASHLDNDEINSSDPGPSRQFLSVNRGPLVRRPSFERSSSETDKKGPVVVHQPRYMEWYTRKKEEREAKKRQEQEEKDKARKAKDIKTKSRRKPSKSRSSTRSAKTKPHDSDAITILEPEIIIKNEDSQSSQKTTDQIKIEDDIDSGIALPMFLPNGSQRLAKKQSLIEKKSVFTIAFNENAKVKKLRIDTASPPE